MNGLFLIRRGLIGRQTLTQLTSKLGKSCSKPGGLAFFDILTIFPLKETVNFENPKEFKSRKVWGWLIFLLFSSSLCTCILKVRNKNKTSSGGLCFGRAQKGWNLGIFALEWQLWQHPCKQGSVQLCFGLSKMIFMVSSFTLFYPGCPTVGFSFPWGQGWANRHPGGCKRSLRRLPPNSPTSLP